MTRIPHGDGDPGVPGREIRRLQAQNRLAEESSLYLRQHAENPVDWYPWGDEAFARATAENRPVLLSVGYSSCHWCHVMAHESFEDPETARVMNEHFVCVKVDREERPDVDALYMQATLALSGHGGWPMTVFLTPDRRPFYAGTYFPPTPRHGMPGFVDLCAQLANVFRSRPDDVERTASELTGQLAAAGRRIASATEYAHTADDAMVGLGRRFDPANGGFGGAPKFPSAPVVEFLLRRVWRRPDDVNAREMADLTLRRMAEGGIHDQIGGGFHRYSVDGEWRIPHFEKMLYDNAQLAAAYALASRITKDPGHRRVAERTLDYALREMRRADGAFAAAQDADSPDGEGAFFAWTPADLERLLTPGEARVAALHWGVTNDGNFEHGTTVLTAAIPLDRVAHDVGHDPRPQLEAARAKLFAARSGRTAPARDDKVVVAWNGLMIAALAEAGAAFGRDDYVAAAAAAGCVLLRDAVADGRLMRTVADGSAANDGCLDDHAHLCHGLLALYAATFAPEWLVAARSLAADMVEAFSDGRGGFFFTRHDAEPLIARTRELEDHPTPAGNSQAARVLLTLAALTGDGALADHAERAVAGVAADAARNPQAFGTALVTLDTLTRTRREVAIVGPLDSPKTRTLIDVARANVGPDDVIAAGDPADPAFAAACPLLADRPLADGMPAAYVCEHFACQAPVTDGNALRSALGRNVYS